MESKYEMCPDFACGKEAILIPAVNTVDDAPPPEVSSCTLRYATGVGKEISGGIWQKRIFDFRSNIAHAALPRTKK